MFVLSDTKSGGIYAIKSKDRKKTVTVFEHYDDAERYMMLLDADDYADTLEIIECDSTVISINCDTYGYTYVTIKNDDLIIPP
tara:strand:+ start:1299 stop:1547 length:249 start_codon:yes stop_codon:yes gene_type:complete